VKINVKDFQIRIENSKDFFLLTNALAKLLEEATIYLTPSKLWLRGMDSVHIVLIDLELPGEYFKDFNVHYEQEFSIRLEEINNVMKHSRKEALTLSANIAENKLTLLFKDKAEREFNIGILDELNDLKSIFLEGARLDYFRIDSKEFSKYIKDALMYSDYATFEVKDLKMTMISRGDNSNAIIKINLDKSPETAVSYTILQSNMYHLNFLKDILLMHSLSGIVQIKLETGLPMTLEFRLPGNGKIAFTLAPRIEEPENTTQEESEEEEPEPPTKSKAKAKEKKSKVEKPLNFLPDESDEEEYTETEVIGK